MNIKYLLSLILSWPIATSYAAKTNEIGMDQKIDKPLKQYTHFFKIV